jgi:uncharacterized protein (TIGR00290 family)
MFISKTASNQEYESELLRILAEHRDRGVLSAVFGDIFLEDVRKHREQTLSRIGMKCIFPLWKKDTHELARSFIKSGFKAVITNVDSSVLGKEFAGREFDEQLLQDLLPGVDPCGENGEFHTFVFDGPMFHERILFTKGEILLRENSYYYCDLIPTN